MDVFLTEVFEETAHSVSALKRTNQDFLDQKLLTILPSVFRTSLSVTMTVHWKTICSCLSNFVIKLTNNASSPTGFRGHDEPLKWFWNEQQVSCSKVSALAPQKAEKIVMACSILHNVLRKLTVDEHYQPATIDSENVETGSFHRGT